MKVAFGDIHRTYGTIADTPGGLVYDGDEEALRHLVRTVAGGDDEHAPAETARTFPGGPAAFLREIKRGANSGYHWARVIEP